MILYLAETFMFKQTNLVTTGYMIGGVGEEELRAEGEGEVVMIFWLRL